VFKNDEILLLPLAKWNERPYQLVDEVAVGAIGRNLRSRDKKGRWISDRAITAPQLSVRYDSDVRSERGRYSLQATVVILADQRAHAIGSVSIVLLIQQ